ncbi:hypothetical protein B6D60_03610, partial [candidate division KSB1 bacterium 4484_87]
MICTRRTYFTCLLLIAFFIIAIAGNLFPENKKKAGSAAVMARSDQIIIRFTENFSLLSQNGKTKITGFYRLDSLNQFYGVVAIRPVPPLPHYFPTSVKKYFSKLYVLKFSEEIDINEILENYSRLPVVDFVEPDYFYFSTFSRPATEATAQKQFSLLKPRKIENKFCKIAILSPDQSGFEILTEKNHQQSTDNDESDSSPGSANAMDFLKIPLPNVGEENELVHYSGLAMTKAARNFLFAWAGDGDDESFPRILPVRAGEITNLGTGKYSTSNIISAIMYAVTEKSGVIVLPFWGYGVSRVLQETLVACDSLNCLVVAAAGEENSGVPVFPAMFENVLAISALNANSEKIGSSNYGNYIDISAHGYFPNGMAMVDSLQKFLSPTILAAVRVASAAAILRSAFPDLTVQDIRERLIFSCENIYSPEADAFHGLLGAGKLNPERALQGRRSPNIIIKKLDFKNRFHQSRGKQESRAEIFFELQNLAAEANDVKIRVLVSDALIRISQGEIDLEKLGFGEVFSNRLMPLKIELPAYFSQNNRPQVILSVETAEGFRTQRAVQIRPVLPAPADFRLRAKNPLTFVWEKNPAFTGYRIYRRSSSGSQQFQCVTEESVTDSIFIDEMTDPGNFEYYITGVDSVERESAPSAPLKVHFVPPPKFSFFPGDTLISFADSVAMHVSLLQPDSLYSLRYSWFVDDSLFASGKRLDLKREDFTGEINTIKLEISDSTGLVLANRRWLLRKMPEKTSAKFEFTGKFPLADTTISVSDSLLFSVNLHAEHIDSVRFAWFMNDSLVELSRSSSFLLLPSGEAAESETVRVECQLADTTLSTSWIINREKPTLEIAVPIFSPAGDTTLFVGDTLLLKIDFPDDSLISCFWTKNGEIDSTKGQSFSLIADSAGTDTIVCRYFEADSQRIRKWIISVIPKNSDLKIEANFSPGDTTIFAGDTLKFEVRMHGAEGDSSQFSWLVNGVIDSAADSLSFTFFRHALDSIETDTIAFAFSNADTTVLLKWMITVLPEQNHPPTFTKIMPDTPFVILESDSCLFSVSAFDRDQDSLFYRWWVNGILDSSAQDSVYLFNKSKVTDSLTVIRVIAGDGVDTVGCAWEIHFAENDSLSLPECVFSPEQDTIYIAPGDSIVLSAESADTSLAFFWERTTSPDSVYRGSAYTFHWQLPNFLTEIITVSARKNDWQQQRNWVMILAPDTSFVDTLHVKFYPESDSVFVTPGDSIRFSVHVPFFSHPASFRWETTALTETQNVNDSVFVFHVTENIPQPESLRVHIQSGDSVLIHQWALVLLKKTLPPPIVDDSNRQPYLTEYDALIWQPDSNLAKSTGGINVRYIVQLSQDSSFSEIISSDTVQTTQFLLADCSQLKKLKPEMTLYWRVCCMTQAGEFSPFAAAEAPLIFYPEFSILTYFTGETKADGISLSWQLSYRGKCKGFNLYRKAGQENDFIKINEQLITGGTEFQFIDK